MTRDDLLRRYASGERDFRGADLHGANFDMAYLKGAHLSGAYLRRASLIGADLSGADLRRADLGGARLDGANLSGAILDGAYLNEADLIKANLSGANLRDAYLRGASLIGADLSGADLSRVEWNNTRLHASGTWSAPPSRCSAGEWHAICVAPRVVRIGCTEMAVGEWIEQGPAMEIRHHVPPRDVQMLRHFLLGLPSEPEGWTEDEGEGE